MIDYVIHDIIIHILYVRWYIMKEKLTKKQKEMVEAILQKRSVSICVTDKNGTRIISTVLNSKG